MNNLPAEKNRRILIIDDNHAIHDDFRKILSSPTAAAAALDVTEAELFGKPVPHGGTVHQIHYEIDSANQGQEGVMLVKQALEAGRPYAMAFVDVRMPPGMDGVETTRKIWELDPDLQVVLCTAYSDYSWDEMFEKLGQHDGLLILKKPFDTVEALQLAHALTEKWQLHQQARQKMEELERMVAERTQELGKSLSLLNATLESTADGILAMDLTGRLMSFNTKFAALWRFPADLLERRDSAEMVPYLARQLKDPETFLQRIKQAQTDPETETYDLIECKDGRTLERYSLPRRIENQCVGVVVNWRDITERKRAEETLRESEERYRQLFDLAADAVILVDSETHRYMDVNQAAQRLYGYSREEFLQMTPEDVSDEPEKTRDHISLSDAHVPLRWHRKKNGERFAVEIKASQIVHQGRRTALVTLRDVTARQRAEEALRESQAGLESAQSINRMGSWELDLTTGRGQWSKAMFRLFDFDPAAGVPQFNEFLVAIHPEERARFVEAHQRVAGSGEQARLEFRSDPACGSIHHFETIIQSAKGSSGPVRRLVGTLQDITERKLLETELNRERDLWQTMLDNSPDHIYFKDTQSRFIKSSKAQALQFGVKSPGEMVGKTDFDFFDEAHARPAFEDEQEIIRTGQPIIAKEEQEVWKDGHVTWASSTKMPLRDETGKIVGIMGISRDITESKRIEARFRRLVDSNAQSVFFWNTKGEISGANDSFLKLVGYTREDLSAGRVAWLAMTPPEYARADQRALGELAANGVCAPYEKEFIRKDGSRLPILIGASTFEDDPKAGLCFMLDLSERKRLEAQLNQSQKMETVGKLAGGIAHEFNSILTAIIGQGDLLREDLPAGSPLAQNAIEICKAADRAAVLTRQLLAYGRKQLLRPEALNLNHVVSSMDGVLGHLMGAALVDVKIVPAAGLELVKADAGQIEQVIMNMAMNARDAMPRGGRLTMETANVTLDQDSVGRYPELKPGDYVVLAISDTGAGMSEKVKAHVFEPFFTTKDVGQGTGLGLSTCFGIIKQSGGHISVYSELGRGTTFKIYLPQVEPPPKIPVERLDSPDLPRGTETILLVEDDSALREMAATLLKRLGYTVLTAANGIEALSLKHQHDNGHIDLLFTDVVMPHMSGKELADRVRVLYPRTRILFTSAYTENAIVHQGVLDKGVALLQKPFTPSALARKFREILDAPASGSASGAEPTARSEPTARRAAPQPDAARETSGN